MENEEEELQAPIEYQLFALSMREPGAIAFFAESLDPSMVGAIHGNQGIHEFYMALVDFHERTGLDPIDPIAFKSWLETETDVYNALGGSVVVGEFVDLILAQELSTPDAVAQIIKLRAKKRRQLDLAQQLQTVLSKKANKTDEDIESIRKITEEIRELEKDLDYDPLSSLTTASDISARAEEILDIPEFLPTPYSSLNKAMGYSNNGGFYRGAVHAVLAESGKGKSTFVKCLQNYWLDNGYSTLYINFEEARKHWEIILMSQIIKQNVYAKVRGWSPQERAEYLEEFKAKLAKWGNRLMVRHDPDTPYFEDLEQWLRDIVGHNNATPDVIVIDTIQSMLSKGGRGRPRWAEFEDMMIRLEKMAKDLDCVLIITAQQNANAMKERREVIMQSDTGGSLTIQQKSSITIFITQQRNASQDDSVEEEIMQLQIPKNRITGSTHSYDPPLVRYNDDTKSYEEYDLDTVLEYNPAEEDGEAGLILSALDGDFLT